MADGTTQENNYTYVDSVWKDRLTSFDGTLRSPTAADSPIAYQKTIAIGAVAGVAIGGAMAAGTGGNVWASIEYTILSGNTINDGVVPQDGVLQFFPKG